MNISGIVRSSIVLVVLAGATVSTPAVLSAAPRVYVRVGPPPPVIERIVVAPRRGQVWTPGFYRWDGRAYLWVSGRYVIPPRPRAVWVPGHWVRERRGWFWIPPTWR